MQAEPVELLERAAEEEAIEAAVAAAADERGGVVLVEGTSGLGKTSLLALAAERAEARGFRVLRAAGDDLEEDLPWGVAVQLFGEMAHDRQAERLFSGAAGLARPLLERAAPPSPDGSEAADAFPLLHGLHWLTAGLCERTPLLLLVDDAHWCDPETLRCLNYLQARIGELRGLLVAAVRPGERTEGPAAELLARLRARPGTLALTLRPLSVDAVRRLVRRELPVAEDRFCDAIADASGGNPFLAQELVVAARAEGLAGTAASASRLRDLRPEGIRNTILVRLARLGEDAARVAAAVAVLGPGATPGPVQALSGLDDESAARAADTLAAAGILVPGERLAFVHPIVREVVYGDLPAQGRRRQHTAAARLLHQGRRPAEQVAPHLEAGELVDEEWAISALRAAAAAALARGAPERAARHLRRALEVQGARADPELVLETGLAELAAAEPAAIEHLEAAAGALGDARLQARALRGLARARYVQGEARAAVEAARTALDGLPAGGGGRLEAELLVDLVFAARPVPGEFAAIRRLLQRPRTGEDGEASPAEVVRQISLAFDAILRGQGATGRDYIGAALPAFGEPRLADLLPPTARTSAAFCLCWLGRHEEAEALIGPELDRARRLGSRVDLAQLLEVRGLVHFRQGHVSAFLADSETLLGLREEGWELATIPIRAARASMLIERGELELAGRTLEVPEEVERRLPGTWAAIRLPWGRAVLAAAAGDWSASLECALTAGERALAIEAPSPDWMPWRSLAAVAAARLGERDRAGSLAREELDLARVAGSPRATGIALAALGTIAEGAESVSTLEAAVAELDRAGALLEGARARVQLGVALRHERRPREARRPLREALDQARRAGSIALAQRAIGELRSAGARPRRPALSGVGSLTPSERRITELAAGGMRNHEIAQMLFVTVRTVETHLTHAYAKLRISSRHELAAALRSEAQAGRRPVGEAPSGEAGRSATRTRSSR